MHLMVCESCWIELVSGCRSPNHWDRSGPELVSSMGLVIVFGVEKTIFCGCGCFFVLHAPEIDYDVDMHRRPDIYHDQLSNQMLNLDMHRVFPKHTLDILVQVLEALWPLLQQRYTGNTDVTAALCDLFRTVLCEHFPSLTKPRKTTVVGGTGLLDQGQASVGMRGGGANGGPTKGQRIAVQAVKILVSIVAHNQSPPELLQSAVRALEAAHGGSECESMCLSLRASFNVKLVAVLLSLCWKFDCDGLVWCYGMMS